MNQRPVEIQVRELVVEGFTRREGARMAASIERELARQFSESRGVLVPAHASEPVRLTVPTRGAATPLIVGRSIAQAIHDTGTGAPSPIAKPGGRP